jgi:diaminohydroxyphosphoribosylaminopyrimidine deaminase/5-amino-6-(5-phosphoribosylamino)uracil reductase
VTDFDKVKGKNPKPIVLGKNVKDLPEGWWCFETIEETLSALYERGIQTLLVEGGRETLQAFIDKGVWDEAYVETGEFSWAEMNREEGVEAVFAPTLKNAERVEDAWFMGHQIEQWRHLS